MGYYIESNIRILKVIHSEREAESKVGLITPFESIYDDGERGTDQDPFRHVSCWDDTR